MKTNVLPLAAILNELTTVDFPTIDPEHPVRIQTEEEQHVLDGLVNAFVESDRLHRHMKL